jgi:hypothetical protein
MTNIAPLIVVVNKMNALDKPLKPVWVEFSSVVRREQTKESMARSSLCATVVFQYAFVHQIVIVNERLRIGHVDAFPTGSVM